MVIVVSGAVPEVPKGLCEQLAEGGRLVCIVSGEAGVGRGILVTRVGSTFGRRDAFDAGTRPLPGFARAPGFVF